MAERKGSACTPGCGLCCDPVILGYPLHSVTNWTTEKVNGYPDPNTDDGWAKWIEAGWAGRRWYVIRKMRESTRYNADFIAAHMRPLLGPETEAMTGGARLSCDAFDPHTRSCTVWDVPVEEGGQPPICRDYPWYGEPPRDRITSYLGCSFQAEFRPFLPIVEVR